MLPEAPGVKTTAQGTLTTTVMSVNAVTDLATAAATNTSNVLNGRGFLLFRMFGFPCFDVDKSSSYGASEKKGPPSRFLLGPLQRNTNKCGYNESRKVILHFDLHIFIVRERFRY